MTESDAAPMRRQPVTDDRKASEVERARKRLNNHLNDETLIREEFFHWRDIVRVLVDALIAAVRAEAEQREALIRAEARLKALDDVYQNTAIDIYSGDWETISDMTDKARAALERLKNQEQTRHDGEPENA